jgi:septal ring factor EnvC (AmiA/AmiB activator)
LTILDCGGGTHAVLAGFERLDARAGQSVRAGAPVGVMPGWDPRGGGAKPLLYVELRRDGQPVDPTPYLRAKG